MILYEIREHSDQRVGSGIILMLHMDVIQHTRMFVSISQMQPLTSPCCDYQFHPPVTSRPFAKEVAILGCSGFFLLHMNCKLKRSWGQGWRLKSNNLFDYNEHLHRIVAFFAVVFHGIHCRGMFHTMWHWFIRSSNICPFAALFTGHVEAVLVWTGRPLLPSLKLALYWIFKFSPNRHFSQSTKCPKSYCWQVFTPPFKQAKKCPFELEFGQHWPFERRFPY